MSRRTLIGFLLAAGCGGAPPHDAEGDLTGRLRRSAGVVARALGEARQRAAAGVRHFVWFSQDARQAQVSVHRDSDGDGAFSAQRDERVWAEGLEPGVHFWGIEPLPSRTQPSWLCVTAAGGLELPPEVSKVEAEEFHRNFQEGRGAVLGDVVLYGWVYVQGRPRKFFYCLLLDEERAAVREEGLLRAGE